MTIDGTPAGNGETEPSVDMKQAADALTARPLRLLPGSVTLSPLLIEQLALANATDAVDRSISRTDPNLAASSPEESARETLRAIGERLGLRRN